MWRRADPILIVWHKHKLQKNSEKLRRPPIDKQSSFDSDYFLEQAGQYVKLAREYLEEYEIYSELVERYKQLRWQEKGK
jgi:hypothetical protein